MDKQKLQQEISSVSAMLDRRDKLRQKWVARAKRLQTELSALDTPDVTAEFLARICQSEDEKYGFGSTLCLDWMLEHYMAQEFESAFPKIQGIHRFLVENGHDMRHKFEYFNDGEAFFVDPERLILVCGKHYRDTPRYLLVEGAERAGMRELGMDWSSFHVRQIWRRTKLDCIGSVDQPTLAHYRDMGFILDKFQEKNKFRIYGDGRDRGHVLSYENMFGRSKCKEAIWDIGAHTRFFFEVGILWTQTVGEGQEA